MTQRAAQPRTENKTLSVALALIGVLVAFLLIVLIGGALNPNLQLDDTALMRFGFVGLGLLIAFGAYYATRSSPIWQVGTREVVYMSIGAALYAIFSYVFNGTVFVVPSVSQVSLRPAIAIPMFFGYAFGPVVGFFTGAVGNMFGDALTGFGLSPQWSVGNGLIGLVAGLVQLFPNKRRSMDTVLIISGVLALLATALFIFNPSIANMTFFDVDAGIFGDQQISLFAAISIWIGFGLILLVRYIFRENVDVSAAVIWGMLGNIIGLGFAAISDIWINGFSPAVAIVGEFLPSAGPNLLFAAILVPLLVLAYAAVQRQSGR